MCRITLNDCTDRRAPFQTPIFELCVECASGSKSSSACSVSQCAAVVEARVALLSVAGVESPEILSCTC